MKFRKDEVPRYMAIYTKHNQMKILSKRYYSAVARGFSGNNVRDVIFLNSYKINVSWLIEKNTHNAYSKMEVNHFFLEIRGMRISSFNVYSMFFNFYFILSYLQFLFYCKSFHYKYIISLTFHHKGVPLSSACLSLFF